MAAAKNRQPDTTPYGIGRLVGITYRKVQLWTMRRKYSGIRIEKLLRSDIRLYHLKIIYPIPSS